VPCQFLSPGVTGAHNIHPLQQSSCASDS
jgi:hypothetical protein